MFSASLQYPSVTLSLDVTLPDTAFQSLGFSCSIVADKPRFQKTVLEAIQYYITIVVWLDALGLLCVPVTVHLGRLGFSVLIHIFFQQHCFLLLNNGGWGRIKVRLSGVMILVKMWSCENCSYYAGERGCTKRSGCDFIPALIRLEEMLTGFDSEYPLKVNSKEKSG